MNENSTVRIRFTCAPKDIIYLNSVFDSYGGLGLMRTLNKERANCAYYSTSGMYKTALEVLEALKREGVEIIGIETDETESIDSGLEIGDKP